MARTSAGTGSTSNYALHSSFGVTNTASHKFTIFLLFNINDVTQSAGYLWMSRTAGAGAYVSVGLGLTANKLSLVTASGEIASSQLDVSGLSGLWRYACWNKSANGLGQFDKWIGVPGSASISDKTSVSGSSDVITDACTANRTVMFAGWGASDTIVAPVGCKLQALAVWFDNSTNDSDIIAMANGTKLPADVTPACTGGWPMGPAETGNILDTASSPHDLTVTGTIGTAAGPFSAGGPGTPPGRIITLSGGMRDLVASMQG